MSPKISITLVILKNTLEFDRKHNTFHPTLNYFVPLENVQAINLNGRLPHKILFIITNVHASKENFYIQETYVTIWRRKDTREAM